MPVAFTVTPRLACKNSGVCFLISYLYVKQLALCAIVSSLCSFRLLVFLPSVTTILAGLFRLYLL